MPAIGFGFVLRVPFPMLAGVDPLIERIAGNLRRHQLIPPGARVVVAVSGGLDSVVLLEVLTALAPAASWQLVVAHANHGLRGRASAGDERFVRALAKRRGLPCRTAALDVRGAMTAGRESLEMAARRLRHAFLARVHRQRSAEATALGHHADDQVELFFLRLFRGAGGRGLGGMAWSSPSPADPQVRLVRPLLDITRADLETFARDRRLSWREDASNRDRSILRNRLRHELIPLIESDYCPGLRTVVPRCMDIVRTDADFVEREAGRCATSGAAKSQEGHLAIQRARARTQLEAAGAPANFAAVNDALESPGPECPDSLPPARKRAGPFVPGSRTIRLGDSAGRAGFHGAVVEWEWRERPLPWPRPPDAYEQFDADRLGPKLLLRHWRPGDRFRPLGFPVPAKLQDIFINRKIPAEERRNLLVAATEEGAIIWAEGIAPGEDFKVTSETRRVLVWKWRRKPGAVA